MNAPRQTTGASRRTHTRLCSRAHHMSAATWMRPPPPGFHGAAAAMAKMEPKALTSLVKSCVLGDSQPDPVAYAMGKEELGGAVNALKFAFRTAIKAEVAEADFASGMSDAGVDSERAAALAAVFESKRGAATAAHRKGLALPELSQFDWKLGVSMASSDWCAPARSAAVSMAVCGCLPCVCPVSLCQLSHGGGGQNERLNCFAHRCLVLPTAVRRFRPGS